MILVYNFLQLFLLVLAFPFLLLLVLGKEKYRKRIGGRLGIGLQNKIETLPRDGRRRIWIHSLSVGEATSALPLVRGLRNEMADACLVFSASTRTGMEIARDRIAPHVDLVLDAPLDLLPVTRRFVRLIRPDLFVLVETDFWPNWLDTLRKESVPMALVNGRISQSSFERYRRLSLFFRDLFRSFSLLSMQTENDAGQMILLGVPADRIRTLGNLKYDTHLYPVHDAGRELSPVDLRIPDSSRIWVCGSSHPGEEEMIIAAFSTIFRQNDTSFLILAPRDPARGGEIQQLITRHGMASMRRTRTTDPPAPVLILDTIGELAQCYRLARVAFIGGSLVDFGGHNPLEAAAWGVPVLFGPHMDDFREIAHDLIKCGGAVTVDSSGALEKAVLRILDESTVHGNMSGAARNLIERNAGVVMHHIQELNSLIAAGQPVR